MHTAPGHSTAIRRSLARAPAAPLPPEGRQSTARKRRFLAASRRGLALAASLAREEDPHIRLRVCSDLRGARGARRAHPLTGSPSTPTLRRVYGGRLDGLSPSLGRPQRRAASAAYAADSAPSSAAGAQYALIQAVSAAVTFMAPQTVFEELSELKEPQEHVIPPCMSERLSAHSTTRRICRIGLPVTNARAGLTGVTGLSNRTTMM